jgi:hypothetical protein
MAYWKYLKSTDDIRQQVSTPKSGWYVKETSKHVSPETMEHRLEVCHPVQSYPVVTKTFISHHGYDRGPKRHKIIYALLISARAGHY